MPSPWQDADSHFRSALAAMTTGQVDVAEQHLRQAATLKPDAPEIWNNLGNVLLLTDRPAEAAASYRQAVRLRPDYAEACLNLALALRDDDRPEEALPWYREAVRLLPNWARARNSLAVALLESGALPEALAFFRGLLQQNRYSPQVLCTLATNGLYSDADPSPRELQDRLDAPGLPPEDAALLHTTLGALLDQAGDPDQAFQHFAAGNRLRRLLLAEQGIGFDAETHTRFVDRLVSTFTADYFSLHKVWGSQSELPIFIVGMPRSGSSLVERILAQHPLVSGAGELRDIPRMVTQLATRSGSKDSYPECVIHLQTGPLSECAERYVTRLYSLGGNAERVIDKMLENFLHLGLIATLFPRGRVIHCRRDPLDTCVSCFTQNFRGLPFTRDLASLGHYYRAYERLMRHWDRVLPMQKMDVDYEQLVTKPEGLSRALVDFCGLDWDDRCLRFHEDARPVRTVSKLQVRRPVYQSSVGRWRVYAKHLHPLQQALGLEDCAGPEHQ